MATHGFFSQSPHSFFIRSPHGFRDSVAAVAKVFINNGTLASAYADDLSTLIWQTSSSRASMAIGVDETIFVVDLDGSDTIVKQLQCSDGTEVWRTSALADPDVTLTTDATHLYLIADRGASSELEKWLPGTGLVWSSGFSFTLVGTNGLPADQSGNIFLTGSTAGVRKIHKFNSSGSEVTSGGWPYTTVNLLGSQQCDSGGNVYYIDSTPNGVKKLDASASLLWTLSPPATYSWNQIFLDGDDNLYGIATKSGSQQLVAYDNANPPNHRWTKTYTSSPQYVATDGGTGNVYTASPMRKYDSSGTELDSAGGGGNIIDVLPGRAPHFQ